MEKLLYQFEAKTSVQEIVLDIPFFARKGLVKSFGEFCTAS